jgi:hypothetical protein
MEQSIYNIIQDQRYTLQEIEELGGELTPELEAKLEIQAHQLEVKSVNYLHVISTKESFNGLIDAEIKRLQAMKKANDNLIDRLKDNLLNAVKTFGNFEVGLHKFGTRKSSTVEVEDVNQLPNEYKTIKITEAADKMAIKKAIESGIEIEGCYIKEHQNLKIN